MNWKKLVGKVAPMIGTALGGPFGGMAGKFLADKMGVQESELEHVVNDADPETMMRIRELDGDFKLEMKKLGLSEEQLHTDDRKNARNMAINTTLIPQMVLAVIFVIGFVFVMYLVFTGDVKLEGAMENIAMFLLGILSAGIVQIMNFFFGSSSGSKEKTVNLQSK